jgi:hypothetical protein
VPKFFILLALLVLSVTGCTEQESAPSVDSDSSQSYASGSTVAVDDNVYTISGEVVAEVNSVTRQISPASGSVGGSAFAGTGFVSGSYFGEVTGGKGYVRLLVNSIEPSTDLAQVGSVSILKVSDTKATALVTGDLVTFKCRRQYEALAAVKDNQKFDREKVETWELDYCRLATAVIDVKPTKEDE